MDPERKNKISVKDIVHKLKLRELSPISGYWYTEISGKRIKMAKELLKRLELGGKVSYVHIKNSGKKRRQVLLFMSRRCYRIYR